VSDRLHIVSTGTANLASVCAAARRAGLEPVVTEDANEIAESALCILPGVGAFGAAMSKLRERRLDDALIDRLKRGRPLLAICLGFKHLLEASEESPDVRGLGVARGTARRFPETVRVPQIGWNLVRPLAGFASTTTAGHAYFANSYRLLDAPGNWSIAVSDYAGEFVAAMQLSPVILACQFHPELSGAWGDALIRTWIEEARRA
jgi:imidazole glycerol phosphate synthase glutamine amidotransferase subunit